MEWKLLATERFPVSDEITKQLIRSLSGARPCPTTAHFLQMFLLPAADVDFLYHYLNLKILLSIYYLLAPVLSSSPLLPDASIPLKVP